jgi:hypothetical protein
MMMPPPVEEKWQPGKRNTPAEEMDETQVRPRAGRAQDTWAP